MSINEMRNAIASVYGVQWASSLEEHRVYAVWSSMTKRGTFEKKSNSGKESKEPEYRQMTIWDYL